MVKDCTPFAVLKPAGRCQRPVSAMRALPSHEIHLQWCLGRRVMCVAVVDRAWLETDGYLEGDEIKGMDCVALVRVSKGL